MLFRNHVVREPCKWRTACISFQNFLDKFAKINVLKRRANNDQVGPRRTKKDQEGLRRTKKDQEVPRSTKKQQFAKHKREEGPRRSKKVQE